MTVPPDNPHVAWRLRLAERLAEAYRSSPAAGALTVAGSVGAGLADEFSDLEIDVYWRTPPTHSDRAAPIVRAGGAVTTIWDFDEDDQEWSDDFVLDGLPVTVSGFHVDTVERIVDEVLGGSADPVMHMRMAAIQRSQPLVGADLVESWRRRAAQYPDATVDAVVEQVLTTAVLSGWSARRALLARGDVIAVRALLTRVAEALARTVLALNRRYVPHRILKWQSDLLANLEVAPAGFAIRLEDLVDAPCADAVDVAEELLEEVLALVGRHTSADVTDFREAVAEARTPTLPARASDP